MKRIVTALLALIIAVLLCGCKKNREKMPNSSAATRFSVVDRYDRFDVLCDLDTGVMYLANKDGALTVLVNWDGSPRCYPGFDAREDAP